MTSQNSNSIIAITSNDSQPFQFAVSMDSSKKKIKIHAKNKHKSDEQYYSEYTEDNLKKIGFHSSLKGFFARLKMAIESRSPNELKAYYSIKSSTLRLILEEISKFDDESTKWPLSLKRKQMERITDTGSEAGGHSTTNGADSAAMQKIDYVVKQFKHKFAAEKEERLKLEQRIIAMEELCSRLTRKLVKVTTELKKERASKQQSTDDILETAKSKVQWMKS